MTDVDPLYPPLAGNTSFLLAQLGYLSGARFTKELAPLGIGPRHFGMLRLLRDHDGQTQQQLSESVGVHRNVMVGMVDELEKRELIERRRHPTDRRAHAVYLLPAGYEVLERGAEITAGLDKTLLVALTPEERATLVSLLQRVADANELRPGVHPGFTGDRLPPSC